MEIVCGIAPVPFLHQPFACTNSYFSSFVPSSVSLWNNLPCHTVTAYMEYVNAEGILCTSVEQQNPIGSLGGTAPCQRSKGGIVG